MADRTLTINHADGDSETYTINRDKFAGVREMSRGHVYPASQFSTSGNTAYWSATSPVGTDGTEWDLVSDLGNDNTNNFGSLLLASNYTTTKVRVGKHRVEFDLTLNSGAINNGASNISSRPLLLITRDYDDDPEGSELANYYEVVEGFNSIDVEVFDDGVEIAGINFAPSMFFSARPSSVFDVSISNLKVTHEPDTVTVDHTAKPKAQSKETTFGGSKSITIKRDIEPLLSKVVGGASAAYSLRDLHDTTGVNKVVRVRRESDNNERDFTAKEVSNGTLQNWTNAQVTPPLDLRELTATGRDGPIIEAAAAYSLRNLSDSYTGSVVDVRRSSDDAVRSFMATEVSDGTLATWVGAGNDGTVSTWYDQSTTAGTPNANHAVQTDAASQPKIVDGGSYVDELRFDGVNDFMVSDVSTSGDDTTILVAKNNSTTGGSLFLDNQAASPKALYVTNSNFQAYYGAASDVNYGSLNNDYNLHFISTNATDSNNRYGSLNGTVDLLNSGTNNYAALSIGISRAGTSHLNGSIKEIIIYNSDQTDNRTAIEANIGEVYSIAGIPAYDNTVNGFVESWYDQSGNGNDATQLTAGSQPKIVDAGSLVTGGLDFDGVDDLLSTPNLSLFTLNNVSSFVTSTVRTGGGAVASVTEIGQGSSRFGNPYKYSNTYGFRYGTEAAGIQPESVNSVEALTSLIAGSSGAEGYKNGTSIKTYGTADTTAIVNKPIIIGKSFAGTPSCLVREAIFYPSDQSANREAIETNINNQYDIY